MDGDGWFATLFGGGFLLLALRVVLGPAVARRVRLRATWYAVTDRRVLAVCRRGSGAPEVGGVFLHNLPGVSVRHGRRGRGSLYFDKTDDPFGLLGIPDPDTVARIVTGAMPADPAPAPG